MALPTNRPPVVPDPEGDLEMLRQAVQPEENPVIKKLAKHIEEVWTENQKTFKPVRKEMIQIYNRIRGQYDTEKLSAIRAFRGSEAYIRVGENKCRAAESWLKDIYRGEVDLPWALEPTAEPEIPDETQQELEAKAQMQVQNIENELMALNGFIDPNTVAEMLQEYYEELVDNAKETMRKEAREICERQEKVIRDQNQEGGWQNAFKDFLYYLTRLKFGCIKGPVLTKKKKQVWIPTQNGYELQVIDTLVNDVYAVSPFNIYPSYGMKHANDGNIIEIHELTVKGVSELIGVTGYSEEEIRAVISKFERGELKGKWFTIDDETEVKRAIKEKSSNVYNTTPPTHPAVSEKEDKILAQEFWGAVSGKLLMEWGFQGVLDPHMQYQTNCWKIGDHVIKAVVNPDDFGRKPYHITAWCKNPDWIVGEGLLEFAAPIEDAINAITRALINNIAIASGPMAEIDKDRIDMKVPIYPWRQIESTSMQMRNEGPAVQYYQPQMHAGELIQAWQFFGKVLDEMTVPAYAQGASQAGVTTGTATVFTQLLAAATRSVKAVVANIDDDIIGPYIQMCYDFLIKNTDDPLLQGDTSIVTKGVSGLQAREQQAQRKVEFLQVAMTPVLSQILGAKNLGALAAQIAKSNDIQLPDMKRLDGSMDMQMQIDQLVMAAQGIDPNQLNGQIANGGGAPSSGQGTNADGSKAGVNNG